MENVQHFDYLSAIMCFLLLGIAFLISKYFRLGLSKSILISSLRMAVQLILIGFFLKYLFAYNSWLINILYFAVMCVTATGSVIKRSNLNWKYFFTPLFLSFLFSNFFIVLYFNYFIARIDHILDARYLISIGGMVLGNSLRANVVGVGNFYNSVQKDENYYFYRLAEGANQYEALLPFWQKSIKAAINPTIASMSTMGIVALPGMMSGQILAGEVPLEAIKYQIAIMIAILVATMLSITLSLLVTQKIVFNNVGVMNPDALKDGKA